MPRRSPSLQVPCLLHFFVALSVILRFQKAPFERLSCDRFGAVVLQHWLTAKETRFRTSTL
jgi:hypothetical protein